MQVSIRPLDVLSRAVAVLLVAVPLAWIVTQAGVWEAEEVIKMSHQELLAYVKKGADASFLSNFGLALLLTVLYVGLVEGVAFVCRLLVRAVRPEHPAGEVARKFV